MVEKVLTMDIDAQFNLPCQYCYLNKMVANKNKRAIIIKNS